MTIFEFLHPLKGQPTRELCLAALYYSERYSSQSDLTVDELRALLKKARVPRTDKLNLADVLSKSAPFVDTTGKKGRSFLWMLTPSGRNQVRKQLGLPESEVEIEHDVSALETVINKISDEEAADYLREAIKCLSVGALRASVVFLWAGAVRRIQQDCLDCGVVNLNAVIKKHDPKARDIKKIDDFAYVKESILLLAAQDLGLFDKNERTVLSEALGLRNKCGHPGKYSPGPKKVSSFIEDMVGIAF